jgi:aspartate/methionine/tyrosine aminotransferase
LRNRKSIIDQQIKRVRKNIAVLETFISEHQQQFTWNRPIGGSICFPRLLAADNTYDFCEQLVAETGIMMAPSRVFQYGDHHVRVGVGRDNFPEVLDLFGRYLDQYHQ